MDADRQLNKAKKKYQESVNNINFETDSTKRSLISKFKSNVLNKDLLTIILDFYKILFTTYIFILEENNKLEPVVQSLSEKRAYEILESIEYVEDKRKLIIKSLELYPFDYYLYYKAFQLGLYNEDLTNILKTLDVQTAIIDNFKNSKYFQVPTKYYDIEKYVKLSQKQNAFISLVSGVDHETILKDELSYYANVLIYKYKNVLNDINKLVDEDVFSKNKNIDQVEDKNNQLYRDEIIHFDEKNDGDLLKEQYGINIYPSIFNEKDVLVITNREEALSYMKSMLDVRILKYKLKEEKLEKEKNERKKERKEKLDKELPAVLKGKRANNSGKKHTIIIIVLIIIVILVINAIVAQVNSNEDAQSNTDSEEIYNNGNENTYNYGNDGNSSNEDTNNYVDRGNYSNEDTYNDVDEDGYDEDAYYDDEDAYYDGAYYDDDAYYDIEEDDNIEVDE